MATAPFPITRFMGRALMLVARLSAVILSLALLALPLQRGSYQTISTGIEHPDSPLMGSAALDLLLHPWIIAPLGLAMLGYLYARLRLVPRHRTRVTDVTYLAAVTALLLTFYTALYLPVLTSTTL